MDEESIENMFEKNTGLPREEPKTFNIWEDDIEDVIPKEFNYEKMKVKQKEIIIASYGEVPYSKLDEVSNKLKDLASAGYTMRSTGDSKDRLNMAGEDVFKEKTDYYLPFKNANKGVKAVVSFPLLNAYELARKYAYNFDNLKNGMKAYIARMIQITVGKYADTPPKVILIYTKCGATSDHKVDFKTTGNLSGLLKYATLLNIKVININKSSWEAEIDSLLESL